MTGLDKIIEEIKLDANNAAEAKITEAKIQASDIINDAKSEAEKKQADIKAKADFDIAVIKSRGEASTVLERRKRILSAKQEIIVSMVNRALEKLRTLPDKDYFDLILKMIKKHALNLNGEVAFSERDFKRLPNGFDSVLAEVSGGRLKLSSQTRETNGGFVLIYGGIEENCSFDAMYSASSEDIKDEIGKMLFD